MYGVYFLLAITTLLFITGIYRILMFFFGKPGKKSYKTAMRIVGAKEEATGLSLLAMNLAGSLSKHIKMDDIRYNRIKNMLKYSDKALAKEPKIFVAENILKSFIFLIPGIVLIPVFPMGTFGCVLVAGCSYYLTEQGLYKNYLEKKREIEYELPRFCAVISEEVKATHDVMGILSRYAQGTTRALREEIKVTIADMNSSNYEAALKRFETRLSIERLAEIVRGLIGTVRGDDTVAYFTMLSRDFDQMELQRLNDMAAEQPKKVGKYQFMVLAVLVINYLVIMFLYITGMEKPI